MPENVTECMLCGSRDSRKFDQRQFRGQVVVNRLCKNCGLVFQSPRMTEAEAALFYQAEYRRLYQGEEGPITKDLSAQAERAEALLQFIRPLVPALSSHLDIGASSGLILQRFRNEFDCRSAGVEPGDAYRKYAASLGLPMFAALLELEQSLERRFQLVSMSHVLEHIPQPIAYLAHLREAILEPGGWLLLEVPNLYAHDCFETAHLFSFSRHTLLQVLEQAGFRVVKVKEHGQPRSGILPLYITLLAQPVEASAAKPVIVPERSVVFKRRYGMLKRQILQRLFPRKAWLPVSRAWQQARKYP